MSSPLPGRVRSGAVRAGTRARPSARPPVRPRLRVAPTRAAAQPSGAFVVLLVVVLAAGLVGLLVLNTAMQRSAFALDDLRQRADALQVRGQILETRVEQLRSPERLARSATDLGMVPMTAPVFLRVADGRVLGDAAPAVAGTGPRLVPAPPVTSVPEPARVPPGASVGAPR